MWKSQLAIYFNSIWLQDFRKDSTLWGSFIENKGHSTLGVPGEIITIFPLAELGLKWQSPFEISWIELMPVVLDDDDSDPLVVTKY